MRMAEVASLNLTLEEKTKDAMAKNDIQGYGQAFVVSEKQKLDGCDVSFLVAFPVVHRNLKYWPRTVPSFFFFLVKTSVPSFKYE